MGSEDSLESSDGMEYSYGMGSGDGKLTEDFMRSGDSMGFRDWVGLETRVQSVDVNGPGDDIESGDGVDSMESLDEIGFGILSEYEMGYGDGIETCSN